MAITTADCALFRELRRRGLIPERPAVLEIGKANWYGDVGVAEFHADLKEFGTPADLETPSPLNVWTMADWYYRAVLRNPSVRTAIDLDPEAGDVHRLDLNEPVEWDAEGGYDLVINNGTTEHVFNQFQAWATIHTNCKVGGLMVHALPLWGWLDHGFYNYQPTFVVDVAAWNDYVIEHWLFTEIEPAFSQVVARPEDIYALKHRGCDGKGAMMHVAFRKTTDEPFRVPFQGIYTNLRTDADRQAWKERRG